MKPGQISPRRGIHHQACRGGQRPPDLVGDDEPGKIGRGEPVRVVGAQFVEGQVLGAVGDLRGQSVANFARHTRPGSVWRVEATPDSGRPASLRGQRLTNARCAAS
ncbi:hypothetical protein ACFPN7_02330 [Amycolatopsis halotolerans]|uniref:hypothetical protein n=1 Tax=Amycolatopsis halotolerans TaxID=330083 RepID=UPI0036219709